MKKVIRITVSQTELKQAIADVYGITNFKTAKQAIENWKIGKSSV